MSRKRAGLVAIAAVSAVTALIGCSKPDPAADAAQGVVTRAPAGQPAAPGQPPAKTVQPGATVPTGDL